MNMIRNNVQIVGIVAAPPQITQEPKKKATFSISCTETKTTDDKKYSEVTNWFNCIAYDGLASVIEKYVTKGKQIAISGKLYNRSYVDHEKITRHVTEIVCTDVLLLGSKGE